MLKNIPLQWIKFKVLDAVYSQMAAILDVLIYLGDFMLAIVIDMWKPV